MNSNAKILGMGYAISAADKPVILTMYITIYESESKFPQILELKIVH